MLSTTLGPSFDLNRAEERRGGKWEEEEEKEDSVEHIKVEKYSEDKDITETET